MPIRASLQPESTKLFFRLLWDARNVLTKVPYCLVEEFILVEQLDTSLQAVRLLLKVIKDMKTDKTTMEGIIEDAVAHLRDTTPDDAPMAVNDLIPALRGAVRTLWTRRGSIEDPKSRLSAIKMEVIRIW